MPLSPPVSTVSTPMKPAPVLMPVMMSLPAPVLIVPVLLMPKLPVPEIMSLPVPVSMVDSSLKMPILKIESLLLLRPLPVMMSLPALVFIVPKV